MLKIPWTERITNIEVLRKMNKGIELINTIKIRKLQYIGYMMKNERRNSIHQSILQENIFGKREHE